MARRAGLSCSRSSRRAFVSSVILAVCAALAIASVTAQAQDRTASTLFARGVTWQQFLDRAEAQRPQWLTTAASAQPPADLVARVRARAGRLRLVAVAEDWCPDSVNVLPHVARLAEAASLPLRIVDRQDGALLMQQHRTPDGRVATPTIVVLNGEADAGAFVERPAIVQRWFVTMATSPDSLARFGNRQAWYDADRGRTALEELTALIERAGLAR